MSLKDQLDAMKDQLTPDAYALLGALCDKAASVDEAVQMAHDASSQSAEALLKVEALATDVQALKGKDPSELLDQLTTRVAAAEKSLAAPQAVPSAEDSGARGMVDALSQRVEVLEQAGAKQ